MVASGRYREWALAGAMGKIFACVWRSERGQDASPPLVLPDGQADLIRIDGVWRIAGPDAVAHQETVRTTDAIIGFRFRPGRAAAWLDQPMDALVNQRPALADIAPGRERQLRALALDAGLATIVATFQQLQLAAGQRESLCDPAMVAAYGLVREAASDVPVVPRLVRELGISERTMRRRFAMAYGYGPKTMVRVLRLQRFLTLLRSRPAEPLAALAFAAGYADQAHLTRECRALTGQTPRALASQYRGGGPITGVIALDEASAGSA